MADNKWWETASSFQAVQQYIHSKCVLMRPSVSTVDPSNVSVTLEPSLFPRKQYEAVLELQSLFAILIDTVSRDHEFLIETFKKFVHKR